MATDMNDYFKKKKSSGGGSNGGGNNSPFNKPPQMNFDFGGPKAFIIYLIGGILLLLFISKPVIIINEGERGILSTNGEYSQNSLLPGLHFLIPFIQKVYIVDTKVRIINYANSVETTGNDADGILRRPAITVLDKRGLPVGIELTIQYRLNAQFASQTISNWGFSWEEKIINPVARDVVRNVVGSFDAESLPQNRNAIANQIDEGIRKNIEGLKNQPAQLQSVQLREIVLPQKVKDQIERVQIAKQEVEKAEQEVQRAKQEALKRAAEAQGRANAIKIRAEGNAQAIKIEADANAQANRVISQSLTTKLLQLEQIKVQGKFNEALQTNKDAKIFLTPGGSTPNIWVDTKEPQKRVSTR